MGTFFAEKWWFVTLAVVGTLFVVVQRRRANHFSPPANARSFAAVRSFTPAELTPYFGTYRAGPGEIYGSLVLAVFFCGLAWVVLYGFGMEGFELVGGIAGAAALAAVFLLMELRSTRSIGPDHIAYTSPVPGLSWSVPLSKVAQCDLVPGKPHPRLRVHETTGRAHSLPLTSELWRLFVAKA